MPQLGVGRPHLGVALGKGWARGISPLNHLHLEALAGQQIPRLLRFQASHLGPSLIVVINVLQDSVDRLLQPCGTPQVGKRELQTLRHGNYA